MTSITKSRVFPRGSSEEVHTCNGKSSELQIFIDIVMNFSEWVIKSSNLRKVQKDLPSTKPVSLPDNCHYHFFSAFKDILGF